MPLCKICQTPAEEIGHKQGISEISDFVLFHCPQCHFSFIENPRLDYSNLYSESYYRGHGADPHVDYVFELEKPDHTIRVYEWIGILKLVRSLYPKPVGPSLRWLDYGCGNGGLVRFIRSTTGCEIIGYDEGWIVEKAIEAGIPIVRQKEALASTQKFDVVTAIEVLEHVEDPINTLREIRSLMKRGGLFFYTTGNALPYRKDLLRWDYFLPEVHISLYEPGTMAIALKEAGFRPQVLESPSPGWIDIIRFKILKKLRLKRKNAFEKMLPWPWISSVVNSVRRVSAHPIGWAVGEHNGLSTAR